MLPCMLLCMCLEAFVRICAQAEMDAFQLQPAADLAQAELEGVKMAYSNEFPGSRSLKQASAQGRTWSSCLREVRCMKMLWHRILLINSLLKQVRRRCSPSFGDGDFKPPFWDGRHDVLLCLDSWLGGRGPRTPDLCLLHLSAGTETQKQWQMPWSS